MDMCNISFSWLLHCLISALKSSNHILIPNTSNSPLCQIDNLHFSHVLEDDLFRKYLVINPKTSNLKTLHRNICLSKKKVIRKLPIQKTVMRVLAKSLTHVEHRSHLTPFHSLSGPYSPVFLRKNIGLSM